MAILNAFLPRPAALVTADIRSTATLNMAGRIRRYLGMYVVLAGAGFPSLRLVCCCIPLFGDQQHGATPDSVVSAMHGRLPKAQSTEDVVHCKLMPMRGSVPERGRSYSTEYYIHLPTPSLYDIGMLQISVELLISKNGTRALLSIAAMHLHPLVVFILLLCISSDVCRPWGGNIDRGSDIGLWLDATRQLIK